MPRPHPHPHALFSLKPQSVRAHDAVNHRSNCHLVSTLSNGELALDIGFHIRSQSRTTLATLGRNDTDIMLEGSSIARLQCSFEMDLDTGVVMLYDRSNNQSTQVFGENAMPFEHGRLRRVVVQAKLNTIIGMGGEMSNLFEFSVVWHQGPTQLVKKIKSYEAHHWGQHENPRLAQTIDETSTILLSQRETRLHTARQLKMRYVQFGDPLGSGQFGTVYKAVDVDSGKLMAVKVIERPKNASKREIDEWRKSLYYALKREVETISSISHPCIIDYITSQGWEEPRVEIFMGLKEGTLELLVRSGFSLPISIAKSVLPQMLQALDFLAWKGIVHRDVKPANILYISQPNGRYQFQLGDFGFCNRTICAATYAGSPLYMAPEIFNGRGQTSKVDVWSLFVTILWTLNVNNFQESSRQFRSVEDAQKTVCTSSKTDIVSDIQDMAIVNPEKRASAAQMIVKCYNGEGLTTPRSQVPDLVSGPLPAAVAARNLAQAPPTVISRTTQTNLRTQRRENIFRTPSRFRVEKAPAQRNHRLQELCGKLPRHN